MLRSKGLILQFFLVPALFVVPFLRADDQVMSHARMVRVSSVSGQVQISHRQGGGNQNVPMNLPIVQGDVLRTGNDGWVEIQLENGSRVRLAPDSQLTFSVLGRFASGSTSTEVDLDDGEAAFAVAAGDDLGPFHVNVRRRVISLKRSSRFRVTSVNSNPLEIVVWKGEVGIFDREQSKEVSVKSRETFTLDALDADHYALEQGAQVDELDDWANQRDEYLIANSDTRVDTHIDTQLPSPALSYAPSTITPGCTYCLQPYYYSGLGWWDPFLNSYWGSPAYWGSPGFAWGAGNPWAWPWLWQPTFVVIPNPRVGHPPIGVRPVPIPPPAVRAAAASPALTVSTDSAHRTVISNEHPAVAPSTLVEGDNFRPANTATTAVGVRGVHVHPPVDTAAATQQPARTVTTGASQPHASPAPVAARPQTVSPAPRTFSPPPRAFSPPAASSMPAAHAASSMPAAHGGGGSRH
jgi:hypothetical protein